ncbi:MAG: class I SAM-dependent methyltransferase [Candidatus Aenigmatarchaeota archaeon]
MKEKEIEKNWQVKILRPEELYQSPLEYYNREMVEKYAASNSIRKIQRIHALKIIEILGIYPPKSILDLGCGVGFSMEALIEMGFDAFGIDINPYMIEKAKEKNLKVYLGDFRELKKHFEKSSFDAIISISAFQWIKERKDMEKIAEGINYILKDGGVVGVQFYPFSYKELKMWEKSFRKYFLVDTIIENPEIPRKRNIYLIMKKLI